MIAESPEQAIALLDQAFNAGDLEGILCFYDPSAFVVAAPGKEARGLDDLRVLYAEFLEQHAKATQIKTSVLQADGIALFTSEWTLGQPGQSAVTHIANTVLRQQQDGGWKALIDNAQGPAILNTR